MYTYAFFKTPTTPLNLQRGIARMVGVVGNDQLSALVEADLDLDALQQDDTQLVQAVLTHDRVICDLFWQTTILPLRFGTWFVSLESLLAHLETNQQAYLEKLNQFEGKAEYRLKVIPLEPAVTEIPIAAQGKDYFLAKKQQFQAVNEQQQLQRQELKGLIDAITAAYPRHLFSEADQGIERLYILVDRQSEDTLYEHLQEWQSQCPHWELILGEALPPYHFV